MKKLIMLTENTYLKNTIPAEDYNTTYEMVIGKIDTYQRTLLIVASSLLAVIVLIAVAGTSVARHLTSSAAEITKGRAGALAEYQALADYQVDSTNLSLTKDIFVFGAVSETDESKKCNRIKKYYFICICIR